MFLIILIKEEIVIIIIITYIKSYLGQRSYSLEYKTTYTL